MLALALAARKRRSLLRSRLMSVLLLVLLASLTVGATGCGGTLFNTAKGTSAITLTCSGTGLLGSGVEPAPSPTYPNGNPNIVNTAAFSLTVQ
jgi:hypothetical protein